MSWISFQPLRSNFVLGNMNQAVEDQTKVEFSSSLMFSWQKNPFYPHSQLLDNVTTSWRLALSWLLAAPPFLADHQKMPPPSRLRLGSFQSRWARRCHCTPPWLSQKKRGQSFTIPFPLVNHILRCPPYNVLLKLMEAKPWSTTVYYMSSNDLWWALIIKTFSQKFVS